MPNWLMNDSMTHPHQPLGPTLAKLALAQPDALAVSDDMPASAGDAHGAAARGSWSRAQMLAAAAAWASHLRDEDERVMLVCPNNRLFFACWLGTIMAGATVFPIHAMTPAAVLAQLAQEAGVTRIAAMTAPQEGSAAPWHDLRELAPQADADVDDAIALAQANRRTGGVLLQSSGTTGLPKIVHRPLEALEHTSLACRLAVGMTSADGLLVTTALSHSYMIDHALLGATLAGAGIHLSAQFETAALAQLARATQATILPTVPFVLDMLANAPNVDRRDLASLRCVYTAGTNLPQEVAHAFASRFGHGVGQIYGSSEFGSVTWQPPGDALDESSPSSVGSAMAGVGIRIIDIDQPDIACPLPAGASGQVAIATPAMMAGYLPAADAPDDAPAAEFLTDPASGRRYFPSGDLGHLDAQGRLFITGRLKLLVDVAGQKVNLAEVESVLAASPDVKLAAVVPMTVTPTLTRLKAMVVWQDDAPGDDASRQARLRSWARARLMAYKLPRIIQTAEHLPVSPTGKILRSQLPASESMS